jgi:FkbM family methyltransferase
VLKQLVKRAMTGASEAFVRASGGSAAGRHTLDRMLDAAVNRATTVRHNGVELVLAVPNIVNYSRVRLFSDKVPETLAWIDTIPRDSVLWDIGANVGHYSCYAAKARGCRVFAFEPSVFNLEFLARNVHLNGLADRVTIVPLPLTDAAGPSALNMTTTQWGGALSTFGRDYGFDGRPLQKVFEFRTVGVTMDDAVSALRIPQPAYIKMDVDGIEHIILDGGPRVLSAVQGMAIEINDAFEEQATQSAKYLEQAGLRFVQKQHAELFDAGESPFSKTFNQVWERAT